MSGLQVITLQEHIDLVKSVPERVVGIIPETKHPAFFNEILKTSSAFCAKNRTFSQIVLEVSVVSSQATISCPSCYYSTLLQLVKLFLQLLRCVLICIARIVGCNLANWKLVSSFRCFVIFGQHLSASTMEDISIYYLPFSAKIPSFNRALGRAKRGK